MIVRLSVSAPPYARMLTRMIYGHKTKSLVCAVSVTLAGALCLPVFVNNALAQSAQSAGQPAKKAAAKAKPKAAEADAEPAGSEASRDGTAAWRDYDAGLQLLNSSQPAAASEKFSKVLAGSNVPTPLMAKTLLQRGIAYRQEGKPAQAVADLTSAMYLRNGLTEPEKAEATAQRSASYREAGLTEQGVASPDQNRSSVVASAATGGSSSGRSIAPSVSVPVAGLAAGTEAPAPAAAASSGGGFFGKLFGSSDSAVAAPAPSAAPAPVTAAVSAWSTPDTATPAAAAKGGVAKTGTKMAAAKTANEVLPWERPAGAPEGDAPSVSKGKGTVAVAAKSGNPTGKFRLQLAAVLSREEAQASAARVKSQFGADIGSRTATIDEAALGAATMYIVRFGPYASAAEIKTLCTRIRATGTDCLQAP
jgi:SPOR domain